jgi:hypothetical protein
MLAALPTFGEIAPVAVYTQFQHEPPPVVVASLKEEVESIMEPIGLPIVWRSLAAVRGNEVSEELAVATFKGSCEGSSLANVPFRRGALGWTHISDGEVLPFTDVECDRIHAFVQRGLLSTASEERNRVFGRALGRVLAHELFHIFAVTTQHESTGVDQPAYTASELLSDQFRPLPEFQILRVGIRVPGGMRGSPEKGQVVYGGSGCSACHGKTGEGTRSGPTLRAAGRGLNSVVLAAKLAAHGTQMLHRARQLKVAAPSIAQSDLPNLASFLSTPGRPHGL